MSFAATDPQFNQDVGKALRAIRELRLRANRENWDPRALRLALKFAMKVDDYFAARKMRPEDEKAVEFLAEHYFQIMLKRHQG